MRSSLLLVGVSLLITLLPRAAYPHHEERATGNPNDLSRVAILPFVDLSGEQEQAKQQYRETALAEVEKRFRMYEVAYVPREEMQAALSTLKLDPADEEDRSRTNMKALADSLKVRYVVTGILYDASSGWSRRGFLGDEKKAGRAKVEFRVFDANDGRFVEALGSIVNATSRAKAFSSGLFSRSSKLRVKAVKDATKQAMMNFLKPYPKVHNEDPGASPNAENQAAEQKPSDAG